MAEIHLDVQLRERKGTKFSKQIRREGFIPAVVYGGGKHGPTTIKAERAEYESIMRKHAGESVVFHMNVMDGKKKVRDYSAIVKDVQLHPVSEEIVHIDFTRISLKEEVEVKVAIAIKGEAAGLKEGGTLDQAMWELDVVCLPMKIPQNIEVDVTELNLGESLHVSDLALPEGVKTNHDPEATVVTVALPAKEEEPSEEGEESDEPEVISEEKSKEKAAAKEAAAEEAAKEEAAEEENKE